MQVYNDELYHYGKLGMKWGKRSNNIINSPRMLTSKRQLAADKKTLDKLNNGNHISVGLTKKRQEAYDARDKAKLEKRITKNENKTNNKSLEDHISKGSEITVKLIKTLQAANEKNKNQKRADELRKNGSGTSAAITEFANNVAYKTKVDRIWGK